jgi:hypothetical protein
MLYACFIDGGASVYTIETATESRAGGYNSGSTFFADDGLPPTAPAAGNTRFLYHQYCMASPCAYVRMHALKGLVCRAHARHASPCLGEALTALRATLAAAPVLFAHACVVAIYKHIVFSVHVCKY